MGTNSKEGITKQLLKKTYLINVAQDYHLLLAVLMSLYLHCIFVASLNIQFILIMSLL